MPSLRGRKPEAIQNDTKLPWIASLRSQRRLGDNCTLRKTINTIKPHIKTKYKKRTQSSSAFTLIELVLSIVILSICLTGTMLAFITIAKSSSDPLIQQQALNICKSYLEEIMAKDFPVTVPCPAPPAGGRPVFANVCDYQNFTNVGARAQDNQAIASLARYTVKVKIDTAASVLGGLPSGTAAVRIDVTVSHQILQADMVISGYRTKY